VQASDVSADARVLHPVAALASVVECYRIGSFVGPRGGQLVTVSPPTWQTELVVGCEPCMEDHAPDGSRPLKPAAFFFGPMQSERGATLHTIPAGTRVASVLFRAGAGPLLFDVSAAETLDQVLDARALLGPEHRGELDRIPDAGSDDALRAALDAIRLDVHWLARHSSLTARKIERRFKAAPGGRTLDAQTALGIVESSLGYHDGLLLTLELFDAVVARERDGDGGRALTALVTRLGDGDVERGATRLGVLFRPDPRGPSISGAAKSCMDLRALRGPLCAPFDATLYPASLTDAIESAELAVPVLYLQGELDTQSPMQTAQDLRPRFPQRSEAILGVCVGHFVLRDANECARAALEPFFAGAAVPDAAAVAACAERACDALPILSGDRALPGE
jgi:pimeloyl-ACP methyl ester carboxylesterase